MDGDSLSDTLDSTNGTTTESSGLSGYLDTLGKVANTGTTLYQTVKGKGKKPAPAPVAPTQAVIPTGKTNWTQIALFGGLGLVGLIVLIFALGRGK